MEQKDPYGEHILTKKVLDRNEDGSPKRDKKGRFVYVMCVFYDEESYRKFVRKKRAPVREINPLNPTYDLRYPEGIELEHYIKKCQQATFLYRCASGRSL